MATIWRRLALVALVALAASAAQAADVEWKVTTGFDGVYRNGSWTPVIVELTNTGSSRKGEVQAIMPAGRQLGDVPPRYITRVELPQNSHKVYALDILDPDQRKLVLALNDGRLEREIRNLRVCGQQDLLAVVISDNTSLLRFLDKTDLPLTAQTVASAQRSGENPQLRVGHTEPGKMPRTWLGWDAADVAVLHTSRLSEASREELDALRQWVMLGGTLVVSGGAMSSIAAGGPLGDLLPMQVSGTRTQAVFPALGVWVGAGSQQGGGIDRMPTLATAGTLLPGARVICGTTAEPLIVSIPRGAGKVVMTTFDPAANPIKYWDGQTRMWLRLVSETSSPRESDLDWSNSYYYGRDIGALGAVHRAMERYCLSPLPGIWLLMGYVLAYVILLVPVNYVVLRRMDRRELAWVTVPLVVAAFTIGGYGMGYELRGTKTLLYRVGLVQTQSNAVMARGQGLVSLYSPSSRAFTLDLQGTAVAARAMEGSEENQPPITLCYAPKRQVTNFRVAKWTERGLEVDFVADLGRGIGAEVVQSGGNAVLSVRNGSDLTLKGCRIVRNGMETARVDVAPGQTVQIGRDANSPAGGISLYEEPPGPTYSGYDYEYAPIDSDKPLGDVVVAAMFQNAGYMSGGSPNRSDPNRPVMVALVDKPMVTAEPVRGRAGISDCTVITCPVELKMTKGRQHLAPWMLERTVVQTGGATNGGYSPESPDSWLSIYGGFAIIQFQVPPSGATCVAHGLQLQVNADSGGSSRYGPPPLAPGSGTMGGASGVITVKAFNYGTGKWVTLKGVGGTYSVPRPEQFMSDDGRVRVLLSCKAQMDIYDVTLETDVEVR